MNIVKTSDRLYRKVVEVRYYKPTKEELFYWYGGTSTLNPDNPYARKNSYSTLTHFEDATDSSVRTPKPVDS